MKQRVILLSVDRYSVVDKETKKINEGTTVRYLLAEDLNPHVDTINNVKGHKPAKAKLLYDDFDKFHTAPALYEATFGYKVDSQGKAALQPFEFSLISPIQIGKPNLKIGANQNPA